LLQTLRSLAEKGETHAFLVAWAYLGLGDRDEAFRWFDVAVEERTSWFTSLRVEPQFADLHEDPRFQRLLARVGFPPSTDRVLHNLPAQPTPIVGREQELKEVRSLLLDPAARIVTLVGPGGVGKTRLAIEACFRTLESFPDGVRFIPLSAVDPPEILVSALARAMGIIEIGPDPREALVTELRDRRVLLVLDGFEHLLPAANVVAELLGSLPELNLLITSQATLRVRGERIFPVLPLTLPARDSRERGAASLERYGAVALFLDRMEAVKPIHVMGPEDLAAIVEICRELDGLPLAIELAAARLRLMSPPALLGRLKDRFDFLVQGPRDLPARHQTLRAVCDWSYGLLDPREQTMFRCVAAFAGGCSLEAAEGMEGARDLEPDRRAAPPQRSVLDLLASLVEKSLVRQVETGEGEPRFQMLETIRQYGLGLLDSLDEVAAVRRRQLDYFLELALRAEPFLTGSDQAEWLDRLDRDQENITAIMDWALEAGEVERAVRLGSALWWFFWLRGHFVEMRTRLDLALQRGADLPPSLQANLLVASGAIAITDGDCELAARYYERAVELERGREDQRGLPRALRSLASSLINLGRYEHALPFYEEALALDREFGNSLGECAALRGLAKTALCMGDLDRAGDLYAESIALARSAGERSYTAYALVGLADVARQRGRIDEAQALYEEGLDLCRRIGSQPGIASALQHLATMALAAGKPDRSEELYREALEIVRRLNNKPSIAISLAGLGASAVGHEDGDRGVRILGAAERLAGSTGVVLPPHEQNWWRERFAVAEEALGSARCAELLEEGRSLSLEAAIDLALEGTGSPAGSPSGRAA
jgi:predicted ATPase